MMIFSPKKKKEQNDKRENFFNDTKKCHHVCCFFSSFAVPLTTKIHIYSQHTTNNTNETEERNESKNDEKEYLFCTRACVCAETVLCYSFHKQGRILLRGFSRFARMSYSRQIDIIRISPRGERARFALNSKRNLRNVLDPVKRFFPRRWRL